MVQQRLELIQQVRTAKIQNRLDGNIKPVKCADLNGTLDTSDYRRPPSTFMDYSRAPALGEQADARPQGTQQPVSLGDAAREVNESKPAGEQAKVVVKQPWVRQFQKSSKALQPPALSSIAAWIMRCDNVAVRGVKLARTLLAVQGALWRCEMPGLKIVQRR